MNLSHIIPTINRQTSVAMTNISTNHKWKNFQMLLLVVGMLTFMLTTTSPTKAAGRAGPFLIKSFADKCLDVNRGSKSNDAAIIQAGCHGGANQRWYIEDYGNGYFRLSVEHSGMCMDVQFADTKRGARIIQAPCHERDNQIWYIQDMQDGTVRFIARHSNLCLDVPSAKRTDIQLEQHGCHNGSNQRWVIE